MDLRQDSINVNRVSETITAKTEKQLIHEYKVALQSMRSELEKTYAKYAKDGVLSYSEMAKYNRLNGLMAEMNNHYKQLSGRTANLVTYNSKAVFEQSYYQTAYSLEMATNSKLSYTLLNPKTVQASVENPIAGLTLSENLRANRTQIIANIKSNITQGLIKGESYHTVAKRMSDVLEGDVVKATRIVRTEAHRNSQQGSLAAAEHAVNKGVKMKKEWIATLDARTRDSHQSLDGKVVEMNEEFISDSGARGQAPGMMGSAAEDINCRCVLGKIVEGAGNTTARQTYGEWAQEHGIPSRKAADQIKPKPVTQRGIWGDIIRDPQKAEAIKEVESTYSRLRQEYPLNRNWELPYGDTVVFEHQKWADSYKTHYDRVSKEFPKARPATIDKKVRDMMIPEPTEANRSMTTMGYFMPYEKAPFICINTTSEYGRAVTYQQGLKERSETFAMLAKRQAEGRKMYSSLNLGNVNNSFAGVMEHEYGHALWYSYELDGHTFSQTKFGEYFKSLSEDEISNGLSIYASSNIQEFFAESFAEIQLPNPRPMAVKAVNLFMEVIKP